MKTTNGTSLLPKHGVFLVGAGVVGQAIARAHVEAGVSFWLIDQDAVALQQAVDALDLSDENWDTSNAMQIGELPGIEIANHQEESVLSQTFVIESIAERLDIKQAFFKMMETVFSEDAILCSNTSTLQISAIAEALSHPQRFCGMHFFMPVQERSAVEIVRGDATHDETIENCRAHVSSIHKEPLVVRDGPGFIVNRLLSPYLNEAMLLLGRGVSASRIESAAREYGMPMSPLELVDWIGARTMFNAGRVFWQAFPSRFAPTPLLPAMIKNHRLGRATGKGFYDYEDDQRSKELAAESQELVLKYQRDVIEISDSEIVELLTIPMWIEAAIAFGEGVTDSADQFDHAMRGGLGFDPNSSWLAFFDALTSDRIIKSIAKWSPTVKSMNAPEELLSLLSQYKPCETLQQFSSR